MGLSKSTVSVTIATGTALSGAVSLGAKVLSAIIIPSAWTAAALTFQASENGTTWYDLYDDGGTEVSIVSGAVAASRRISLDPSAFASVSFVKVRSGVTATPVAQAADRVLTLVTRNFYALS